MTSTIPNPFSPLFILEAGGRGVVQGDPGTSFVAPLILEWWWIGTWRSAR